MLRIASVCFSRELEALARASRVGVGGVLGAADDLDHLVDVVDGDLEALEDVLPGLGGVEVELGAPDDDLVPVRRCTGGACSFRFITFGAPLTSASMMTPKVDCIEVCL